jgi:hypothetical protein
MVERPALIDEAWIRESLRGAPADIVAYPADRRWWACLSVIKHFFGRKWIREHILGDKARGFLAPDTSNNPKRTLERNVLVIELAETLVNLQRVSGFYECIARMREGQVEATYAELDLGKLLFIHKLNFEFVVPQGKRGRDYDVEFRYPDGYRACGDAKCKLEASDFSQATVENSLREAREQLPADRAGVAFIKVPQHWLTEVAQVHELENCALEWLRRNTQRIVSVKFYASVLFFGEVVSQPAMQYKEITNPRHRFPSRDWDLFEDRPRLRDGMSTGMPDHWFTLFYFPDGPDAKI